MVGFGAVGTITGGRLADRFGRLPVTRASFVATIFSLLAVVLTPLPWVFLPIAVTGFVLFQSFSLTVTLGQDYLPTRIGTSSGVTLGLAISVGGLVAPGLGALADATSLRVSLLVLLGIPARRLAIACSRNPRSALQSSRAARRPPPPPSVAVVHLPDARARRRPRDGGGRGRDDHLHPASAGRIHELSTARRSSSRSRYLATPIRLDLDDPAAPYGERHDREQRSVPKVTHRARSTVHERPDQRRAGGRAR